MQGMTTSIPVTLVSSLVWPGYVIIGLSYALESVKLMEIQHYKSPHWIRLNTLQDIIEEEKRFYTSIKKFCVLRNKQLQWPIYSDTSRWGLYIY